MLRALSILCLSPLVAAQDPAARTAEALLRGDVAAAAEAAASAEAPALRARLQAALVALPQRPAAMLAVANRFADSEEADAAILAGAAAILALRDGGTAVPDLVAWLHQEDGDRWAWSDGDEMLALAPLLEQLGRSLDARVARAGDNATLQQAHALLQRGRLSRFGFVPARVQPQAAWTLPERREELQLRAWRRQPGIGGWDEASPTRVPDLQLQLPAAQASMPALGPGDWLLQLASTASTWRAVRTVEVSDLDVVALCEGSTMAIGAWQAGRPANGCSWHLRSAGRDSGNGVLETGAGICFPTPLRDKAPCDLLAQVDGSSAWAWPQDRARWREWQSADDAWEDSYQAHLMLDRSLYRPGQLLQGRVVLRRCHYERKGRDLVASTAPARNTSLCVVAFARDHAHRLPGRTDDHGVFRFELPVPDDVRLGSNAFAVEVEGNGVDYEYDACQIANYRRPAMLVDFTGPETVAAGAADPHYVVQVHWASGAPAAGVPVDVEARSDDYYGPSRDGDADTGVEHFHLVTDGDGRAVVTVTLRNLARGRAQLSLEVDGPDGRREERNVRIWVETPAAPAPQYRWLHVKGPELATVGEPCEVHVFGDADAKVLFVAGRGHGARVQQLQLDGNGEGLVAVTPTCAEWPWLDLAVATLDTWNTRRVPVQLRAGVAPAVEVPQQAKPGEQVACRVATGVAGTIVTVAVVDERIFAMAPDPTSEPNAALRPLAPSSDWTLLASGKAITPKEMLGAMLEHGRVPAPGYRNSLDPRGASHGGPGDVAPPGLDHVREDFRATAAFATVITGADGVAVVPVTLPDDLTTWRVSIVAVAPDGISFQLRRQLVTRLPLAAEPLLPRVLRAGDQVVMPVAIDRAAAAVADGAAAQLTAASDAAALAVEPAAQPCAVAPGSATTVDLTLHAGSAGAAQLSLGVELGALRDRSRHTVAVQADAVTRVRTAAAMGSAKVQVPTPAGVDPARTLEITVLGGSNAAWQLIRQRLEDYPYGCVEQTLSRLLPYFAAVRGARAHAAPVPAPDKQFQQRLDRGMQHLRQLQHGRGGGFAFWPNGETDPGMTVLVLHGLGCVRDSGVDPASFGLTADAAHEPFASAMQRLAGRQGVLADADDVMAAELIAACLRSSPASEPARAAMQMVIDSGSVLTPGLLARTGLALLAAGDRSRAAVCLQRSEAAARPAALLPDGFPGCDPLAVQSQQLELACLLQTNAEGLASRATDVLQQCLREGGSTFAMGCALSALALALPFEDASNATTFAATVRAGDTEHSVTLDAEHGYAARVRVPFAAACTVTGPANRQLLLVVNAEHSERASDHAAWQEPLAVTRQLCRRLANATDAQRQRGNDLVPIDLRELRAGEVLWLLVRLHSPVPARYVVVDCPLPAGFELPLEPDFLERFDDRVAFTIDRLTGDAWRAFAVMPRMSGTVIWPPVSATPMYATGCAGGTAGTVLTVHEPKMAAAASTAVCFAAAPAPLPVAAPTVYQRADEAAEVVRAACRADATAAERAAADTAFATLTQLATAQNDLDLLQVLDWLLDALRQDRDEPAQSQPDDLAQACLQRASRLQRQLVWDVIGELQQQGQAASRQPPGSEQEPLYVVRPAIAVRIERASEVVASWPESDAREAAQAALAHQLAARRMRWPEALLDGITAPAVTAALRTELLLAAGNTEDQWRHCFLELMPRTDVAAVPPTLLTHQQGQSWSEVVTEVLLGSPSGRAEISRCLQQKQTLARQSATLARRLPDELWALVPLDAYADLAWNDQDTDDPDDAALRACYLRHLAESPITTAALQQELAGNADLGWRLFLAQVLQRRSVRDLGAVRFDREPQLEWWARALAVGAEDVDAAAAFASDAARSVTVEAASGRRVRSLLLRLVLPQLAAKGTVAQLLPVAGYLTGNECRTVYARLDPSSLRALLTDTADLLSKLPAAADAGTAATLWDYGKRLDEGAAAIDALARTDAGLYFLKARLDAGLHGEVADSVRAAYAAAMGFDMESMQPRADAPLLPLLRAARRNGLAAVDAAQRQRLDELRALRGVR